MHEEDYAMDQQLPLTLIAGRSRTSGMDSFAGNNEVTSKGVHVRWVRAI
jgi:hypothetical protein